MRVDATLRLLMHEISLWIVQYHSCLWKFELSFRAYIQVFISIVSVLKWVDNIMDIIGWQNLWCMGTEAICKPNAVTKVLPWLLYLFHKDFIDHENWAHQIIRYIKTVCNNCKFVLLAPKICCPMIYMLSESSFRLEDFGTHTLMDA